MTGLAGEWQKIAAPGGIRRASSKKVYRRKHSINRTVHTAPKYISAPNPLKPNDLPTLTQPTAAPPQATIKRHL